MWLVLSIFLGFASAQYSDMSSVISSSWSMWSPWSFCSNNVMVRVRACSTVRGFKCVGHNKEFQSCDSSLLRPPSDSDMQPGARRMPPLESDVDVVDPYSEDRKIAMRQLYQDYEVEVPDAEKTSLRPRVRPPVLAPPREPLIIAQYARRFPQPPASEGLHIERPGERNTVDLSRENTTVDSPAPPSTLSNMFGVTTGSTTTDFTTTPAATTTLTTEAETATAESSWIVESTTPLLTISEDSGDFIPSTNMLNEEESIRESQGTTANYAENTVQQERESFPITTGEEDEEDGDELQLGPSEEQSSLVSTDNDTSRATIVSMMEITTTSPSTTASSTPAQRKSLVAANHMPRTAVNIKGTSFIVSASQFPIKNPAAPPPPIRTSTSPSLHTGSITYERENLKGKLSRQQRLRKLNRRARVRPLALMPTATPNATKKMTEQKNREELEKQVESLRSRIRKTKKKLAAAFKTTANPALEGPAVEGDTARALSWMFANVAKLMDEKANVPIVDKVPVEKIDAATDQVLSRLPSGVEVISEQDQFILKEDASSDPVVKVDRRTTDDSEMSDVEWSEWSSCNCGAQSRITLCEAASDPSPQTPVIDYRKRQRRSPRLCGKEYETRPCHSDKCQL